jgi:hypothetical protein
MATQPFDHRDAEAFDNFIRAERNKLPKRPDDVVPPTTPPGPIGEVYTSGTLEQQRMAEDADGRPIGWETISSEQLGVRENGGDEDDADSWE